MIICSQCGSENREGAHFCRKCGQILGGHTPIEIEVPIDSSDPLGSPAEDDREYQKEGIVEEPPTDKRVDNIGELPHPKTETVADQTDQSKNFEKEDSARLHLSSKDEEEPDTFPGIPASETGDNVELPSIEDTEFSSTLDQRLSVAEPIENSRLSDGDLLQNRYRIVEILSQSDEPAVYVAEDLLLCWNCDQIQVSIDETYCEACGAAMDQKVRVVVREIVLSSETPEIDEGVFEEGGTFYLVELQDDPLEKTQEPAIQLEVGYQSDAGEAREVNEDSILILNLAALCESRNVPLLGFFALADGIGGHDAGEIASRAVLQSLASSIMEHIYAPEVAGNTLSLKEKMNCFKEAVLVANQAVLDIRAKTETDMGSTLTAVLIHDTQAVIVNIGDSRTYMMRSGKLSQITEDHSLVAKMVAQNVIQPEEIYTHEQKGVIYRSLGDKPELALDDSIFEVTLNLGDRLLLCCDGLWEMVRDDIIEDTLLEFYDPKMACDKLVKLANLAGGDDNISVIVVEIRSL